MKQICECCGQPGGVCIMCGSMHRPRTTDGCEGCAPEEKPEDYRDKTVADEPQILNNLVENAKKDNQEITDKLQRDISEELEEINNELSASYYVLGEGELPDRNQKLFLMNMVCSSELAGKLRMLEDKEGKRFKVIIAIKEMKDADFD